MKSLIVALCCIALTQGLAGQISADIKTNTISGVAPLPIFFDGSNSTDPHTSKPFHDLFYQWSFGDYGEGLWMYSEKSRNQDTGPVAGHLYQWPGNYTAEVQIQNQFGEQVTETISILVLSPEEVYPGENTICFSQSGNFDHAPVGAKKIITSDFSEVMSFLHSGKRLLLHRGESWFSPQSYSINVPGPIFIGAFGEGAKPEIRTDSEGPLFELSGDNPLLDQCTFQHLDLIAEQPSKAAFLAMGTCRDITFHQMEIQGFQSGIQLSIETLNQQNQEGNTNIAPHTGISIVDCTIKNLAGSNSIGFSGAQFILQGNTLQNTTNGGDVLQFPFLRKAAIGHNSLAQPGEKQHLLNLYAPSWDTPLSLFNHRHSEQIVLSNNEIVGGINRQNIQIGPENHEQDQRIRDVIIEKNFFRPGNGNQNHLALNAQFVSVRNNIFNLSGMKSQHTAISIKKKGVEPTPEQIFICNNTAVGLDNPELTLINAGFKVRDIQYFNNLVYAPESISTKVISYIDPSFVEEMNIVAQGYFGFIHVDFNHKLSYQPQGDSEVVDKGVAIPIFEDYFGYLRQNTIDVGAAEYAAITTDVKTLEAERLNITLAPNPSSQIVQVQSTNKDALTMVLWNSNGSLITSFKLEANSTHRLNVSNYPRGVYWISIKNQPTSVKQLIIN